MSEYPSTVRIVSAYDQKHIQAGLHATFHLVDLLW
jgi:hypothetical protein